MVQRLLNLLTVRIGSTRQVRGRLPHDMSPRTKFVSLVSILLLLLTNDMPEQYKVGANSLYGKGAITFACTLLSCQHKQRTAILVYAETVMKSIAYYVILELRTAPRSQERQTSQPSHGNVEEGSWANGPLHTV